MISILCLDGTKGSRRRRGVSICILSVVCLLVVVYLFSTLNNAMKNTTRIVTKQSTTRSDAAVTKLPTCPPIPQGLLGHRKVAVNETANNILRKNMHDVPYENGGHSKPAFCVARHKVAIIIPFRRRDEHLSRFLLHMHPVFQRQQLDYQVFVINQVDGGLFNRNKLLNVGFMEALKMYPFDCFVIHDVDMILEDDRNLYWCSKANPVHLAVSTQQRNYRLPYPTYIGGVLMVTKNQMEKINGFSNRFRGWGAEDDDTGKRFQLQGYKIHRPSSEIARYSSLPHVKNKMNGENYKILKETAKMYKTDGLSDLTYELIQIEFRAMYTNITVDIGESQTTLNPE